MAFKLRHSLTLIFIFLLTTVMFLQTHFEKGEFITNADETVACFIKNIDWKNNPTEFKYKLEEDGEVKDATIETVKTFEIYGASKYKRATVNLDRSSNDTNELSENKNPVFNEEQLFLNVIIEGKANLYYYEDSNLIRFFII